MPLMERSIGTDILVLSYICFRIKVQKTEFFALISLSILWLIPEIHSLYLYFPQQVYETKRFYQIFCPLSLRLPFRRFEIYRDIEIMPDSLPILGIFYFSGILLMSSEFQTISLPGRVLKCVMGGHNYITHFYCYCSVISSAKWA